jgi:hypothetical protein
MDNSNINSNKGEFLDSNSFKSFIDDINRSIRDLRQRSDVTNDNGIDNDIDNDANLIQLLLSMFSRDTNSFITDIEDTDSNFNDSTTKSNSISLIKDIDKEDINAITSTNKTPLNSNNSLNSTPLLENSNQRQESHQSSSQLNQDSSNNSNCNNKNEKLPLDEIIISTHTILLLQSFAIYCQSCSNSIKDRESNSNSVVIIDRERDEEEVMEVNSVIRGIICSK